MRMTIIAACAVALGACSTTSVPAIEVRTVPVPTPVPCVDVDDMPAETPEVPLTGDARIDSGILLAENLDLRAENGDLRALIVPGCTIVGGENAVHE